ncbi:TPR-like protein, partial [Rozella allomycis CSF55]
NDKGLLDIQKALKLDPDFVDCYLERASYLQKNEELNQAITDCSDALVINPKCLRAYLIRAQIRYKLDQKLQAISDYTKAISIDHNSVIAYYNRGVVYQSMHNYSLGIKDYSICLLILPGKHSLVASVYRNRALLYWRQGYHEFALSDLYYARERFPKEAKLHALLGMCLEKLKRYKEALNSYSTAIKYNPFLVEIYLCMGNVQTAMDNIQAAKSLYQNAIRIKVDYYPAYLNLAYTLQMQGKFKRVSLNKSLY